MVKLDLVMSAKKYIMGSIVLWLIFAAIPFMIGFNQYILLLIASALLYGIFVMSWNIIGGYAGQLDLGAFAYIALGGIIAAQLLVIYGLTPWVGMFVGALGSIGLAIIIGFPTFRFGIREVWYALLSAALVVILNNLFHVYGLGSLDHYLPQVSGWEYLIFPTYQNIYWVIDTLMLVVILINLAISHSKIGYYLRAIREDELAAEALGIDVRRYKLIALITYSGILGFVGYIYVVISATYSYNTFNAAQSIAIAIMGIIGGLGSIAGSLVSGFSLKLIGDYLRGSIGATIPGLNLLVYGILLVLIGVFEPDGFAGIYRKYFRKKRGSSRVSKG